MYKISIRRLKAQLKFWNTLSEEYKLDDKFQIIQWYAYDPGFKPNILDQRFKSWITKWITTFCSYTKKWKLKDSEEALSSWIRYLQIRNYFEHIIKNKTDLEDPILKIYIGAYKNDPIKGVILDFTKTFWLKKPHITEYIKGKWEREGNLTISDKDWKCTTFFITPKQKAQERTC